MTLKWMLHRITHRKRTYILLGLLLIGFSVTGGVTRYYSANHELMLLNMAFATNFDTMDAWQSWHERWQYTWLVSAISMTGLLPLLLNIIPHPSDPELTVPVTMGQSLSLIHIYRNIRFAHPRSRLHRAPERWWYSGATGQWRLPVHRYSPGSSAR